MSCKNSQYLYHCFLISFTLEISIDIQSRDITYTSDAVFIIVNLNRNNKLVYF